MRADALSVNAPIRVVCVSGKPAGFPHNSPHAPAPGLPDRSLAHWSGEASMSPEQVGFVCLSGCNKGGQQEARVLRCQDPLECS